MFSYLKDFGPDKLLPYLIIFSRGNPAKNVFICKYSAVSSKQISMVAVVRLFRGLLIWKQDTNSES